MYLYINNRSFFKKSAYINVYLDKKLLKNGFFYYSNEEFSTPSLAIKIEPGSHELKATTSELSDSIVFKMTKGSRYCYITLNDFTNKSNYEKGQIKLNISCIEEQAIWK